MTKATREYFRPSEAKSVIGVSRSTIYKWAKENKIKLRHHCGMSFVKMSEIEKLLNPMGDQVEDGAR